MRVLQLLAIAVVVALVLYLLLRPRRVSGRRPPPALTDELVKDPMCGTYVVRSRAVSGVGADGPIYFCSPECARRYETETRG